MLSEFASMFLAMALLSFFVDLGWAAVRAPRWIWRAVRGRK